MIIIIICIENNNQLQEPQLKIHLIKEGENK